MESITTCAIAVVIPLETAWRTLPVIIIENVLEREERVRPRIIKKMAERYNLFVLNLVIKKAENGIIIPMTRE